MGLDANELLPGIKGTIALFVGGIGSILLATAFLFFESVLIRRDNQAKTRLRADALHRQSIMFKKRAEERELQEKAENAKRSSPDSSSEDEDDNNQTQLVPGVVQGGEKQLNGFFRRESAVSQKVQVEQAGLSAYNQSRDQTTSDTRNTNEFTEVEIVGSQGRRESTTDFKDTLAAALQTHMMNLRRDSVNSSRRPSIADGVAGLPIDSCRSSLANSRRASLVDSALPPSSHRSSLANSRRPSTVTLPEALRTAPDYESLKFMAGQNVEDSREPPKYGNVVSRSRRGSLENQLAAPGYQAINNSERRPSKTFEVVKLTDEVISPSGQSFDGGAQQIFASASATNDPLPSIPESPYLHNKGRQN